METPKKVVFDFKQYAVLKSKIRPYAANEAIRGTPKMESRGFTLFVGRSHFT